MIKINSDLTFFEGIFSHSYRPFMIHPRRFTIFVTFTSILNCLYSTISTGLPCFKALTFS